MCTAERSVRRPTRLGDRAVDGRLFPNCALTERRVVVYTFWFSMRWHSRATRKVVVFPFSTGWLVSLVDGKLNFHVGRSVDKRGSKL